MCRSRRRSRIASMSGSRMYRSGWARRSTRSGEPSSSAANATAAARLPTPGGPWSRYACAGPSASAARSRRFASGCSGKLSNLSTDLHGEVAGRLRPIERDDPLGEHRGQLSIGPVHGGAKVTAFALDTVGIAAGPPRRLSRVEEDQEGAIREEPARGLEVQLQHALDAEAARDPLVGERGVDVAVADDVRAVLERGLDHARDELGTRGREEGRLGPRRQLRAVQQKLPHALTEVGPPGLTRSDDLPPLRDERLTEEVGLGRFARAV